MDLLSLITMLVTLVLGSISKKCTFICNNLIPIQNLLIGLLVALFNYLITKNFESSIALSGLFAGGVYDIYYNVKKIMKKGEKNE